MRNKSKEKTAPSDRNTRDGKSKITTNDFVCHYTCRNPALSMGDKPNLMRVASEISAYDNLAGPVAAGLVAASNNAKFYAMLNGCKHPRQVYQAMSKLIGVALCVFMEEEI